MDLHDLEGSWKIWTQWVATDRRFLPVSGGLLDQPEALMEDLFTLDWLYRKVAEQLRSSGKPAEE